MKNVIYYQNVLGLGGTTTYEIELCKKYCDIKDITLYYKEGDFYRINELKHYVHCVKWEGEEVECDNFFTNYEFDQNVLDQFKAKKYYQVIHCQYKTNKVQPKLNDKFDLYICVSWIVLKEYKELTKLSDEKLIVSPNPLTIEDVDRKPPLIIGSFTRLSWEKGEDKMKRLIQELDRQKVNYLWFIYTNDVGNIRSENVIYHEPKQSIRNLIAMCDIVAQLSLCEGDCYTIKEAKAIMDKVLITPCPSFFEMGCDRQKDIVLEQDMSNIDEVVYRLKDLANKKQERKSSFIPKQDRYNELLEDGISYYTRLKDMKFKVKALKKFEGITDSEVGRVRKEDEIWIVDGARKDLLEEKGLVEVVEEIKDEVIENAIKPKKEVKKAVRKSSKNVK